MMMITLFLLTMSQVMEMGDSDDDDEDSSNNDDSVHSSSDEFDSVDDESDNGNNNDDSGNNKNDHNSRTVDNKDIEKDKKEIITVVKTFFSQRKMCLPQQVWAILQSYTAKSLGSEYSGQLHSFLIILIIVAQSQNSC